MRGEVVVGLDKELLQKLEEHVKSNSVYKIACAIKKMVVEFFRSPHELQVDGKRPRRTALRVRMRLPNDVYYRLKEYAKNRGVSMPSVVRAIIAERLGVKFVSERRDAKKQKRVREIGERLAVVTFKIEKGILEKIDLIANNMNLPRSEIIREALETFLKRYTTPVVTREI